MLAKQKCKEFKLPLVLAKQITVVQYPVGIALSFSKIITGPFPSKIAILVKYSNPQKQ